jgi:trehalose 6-phosphate phosphatase
VREARSLLSAGRTGLLTDLDGTLSAIAPRPDLATVSPGIRRALRDLVARLAVVAVLSGRSAKDARHILRVPGVLYVGNHGLEAVVGRRRWQHPGTAHAAAPVSRALAALEQRLRRADLLFEAKGLTGSIHYRAAASGREARADILRGIRDTPEAAGLCVTEGRRVVELKPPVGASKGTAARCLLDRYGLESAVYLGDDRTDLDAVRVLQEARATSGESTLTIAVASREAPRELLAVADGVLPSVAAVEAFLGRLTKA